MALLLFGQLLPEDGAQGLLGSVQTRDTSLSSILSPMLFQCLQNLLGEVVWTDGERSFEL